MITTNPPPFLPPPRPSHLFPHPSIFESSFKFFPLALPRLSVPSIRPFALFSNVCCLTMEYEPFLISSWTSFSPLLEASGWFLSTTFLPFYLRPVLLLLSLALQKVFPVLFLPMAFVKLSLDKRSLPLLAFFFLTFFTSPRTSPSLCTSIGYGSTLVRTLDPPRFVSCCQSARPASYLGPPLVPTSPPLLFMPTGFFFKWVIGRSFSGVTFKFAVIRTAKTPLFSPTPEPCPVPPSIFSPPV